MRFSKTHLMLSALIVLLMGASTAFAADDDAYVVREEGRGTWRALFDRKMDTSAEQWEYAQATRNKGWLRKADRRMLYLVRRWPNSKEAPRAARARADMLYARGKIKDAFSAYQYLIDNYPSRMLDYDGVLQSQFEIASDIMNHRRMHWVFGGYRAPEYAVEYFESVIRNGPQWSRAPEAQYLIGRAYQEAKELELAVSSYATLGYRYPDSTFAEEGMWQQILCLQELSEEYPNNAELLDEILTTSTVFLSTYPQSQYRDRIVQLRNQLYEVKAGNVFDEAEFYAKVPKEPEAAVIYYTRLIEEFPKSSMVPEARERIAELERLMAMPTDEAESRPMRSTPLPFGKDPDHAEG